ncbi:hypothetical protein ACHHYP_20456 [Achlya hypogyna]|uniref:Uncharacterized protein n=1 Tax=Achlya hypogyna TaxID=1202772 RepID=A0A1V9ZID5_ACHHY|nr:hypothetical protein ACHHYP_20456 [Achlya hypogyna]
MFQLFGQLNSNTCLTNHNALCNIAVLYWHKLINKEPKRHRGEMSEWLRGRLYPKVNVRS